jgi:hypothetical protein
VAGQSPAIYDMLKRLQKKLHKEIIAQQQLYSILGSLELVRYSYYKILIINLLINNLS